jgi:hypothetical protein
VNPREGDCQGEKPPRFLPVILPTSVFLHALAASLRACFGSSDFQFRIEVGTENLLPRFPVSLSARLGLEVSFSTRAFIQEHLR